MILIINSTEIVMLAQYLINIELVKRYYGEDTERLMVIMSRRTPCS